MTKTEVKDLVTRSLEVSSGAGLITIYIRFYSPHAVQVKDAQLPVSVINYTPVILGLIYNGHMLQFLNTPHSKRN